jgi:hypothetical protein
MPNFTIGRIIALLVLVVCVIACFVSVPSYLVLLLIAGLAVAILIG